MRHLLLPAVLVACHPPEGSDDPTVPGTTDPTPTSTGKPPGPGVGLDTMCGDQVCQDSEDVDLCPWDCVPYALPTDPGAETKLCDRVYTGFVPLPDIGPSQYLGVAQGGLYPGGSNERPPEHTRVGVTVAEGLAPIDGSICVMSVGMSNTSQKWDHFASVVAPAIGGMSADVVLANGAVGGNAVDTTADADHRVWTTIESQLNRVGCSLETVQVAWILHAERGPAGDFVTAAEAFQADLRSTVIHLADKAPNLAMIYLSPRVYAGYGTRNNNPEPYAHQGGFAIKWLIASQIDGSDEALSLDAGFPWMSWGPYLWSDGLGPDGVAGGIPGRDFPGDGLEYACEDFSDSDGIHPGPGSRRKVGQQLEAFFTSDPTTTPWFLD